MLEYSNNTCKSPNLTLQTPRTKGSPSPLHAAAINGDKATLQKLLKEKADVNARDQYGRVPLVYCVLGHRVDCADQLLRAGADVCALDNSGRSVLHWAAIRENIKLMKLLLSRGADWRHKDSDGFNVFHHCMKHNSIKPAVYILRGALPGEIDDQDRNKRTALHLASLHGSADHVRLLLNNESNVGIPDVNGKTPLHWAISAKNANAVQVIQLLLEAAPGVINWQDYDGRTALHLAVAEGNYPFVDLLTSENGCKLECLDNLFRTPLHWAAVLGHSKIVKLLLDRRCDWTCSDSNGATPLHYAALKDFEETVEVFLQHPGLTDEPDIEGRTALLWAAGKGSTKVLSIMLQYNPNLSHTDKNGATVLHAAAMSGNSECVKILLETELPVDSFDNMKLTPLFRAAEMGHLEVAQNLIDYGARVMHVDQDGRYPIHWAALGGHTPMCELMIRHKLDPNCSDRLARTPLQCAAYGGFSHCMHKLMQTGADPNLQDAEGMTALHWSCSLGYLEAVKLLIKYGAFPNHMEFSEERYTPLDYALLNSHQEIAQYLMEQGALTITRIRDISAAKIQAVYKGFRIRNTFRERKELLVRHERLRRLRSNNPSEYSTERQFSTESTLSVLVGRSTAHIEAKKEKINTENKEETTLVVPTRNPRLSTISKSIAIDEGDATTMQNKPPATSVNNAITSNFSNVYIGPDVGISGALIQSGLTSASLTSNIHSTPISQSSTNVIPTPRFESPVSESVLTEHASSVPNDIEQSPSVSREDLESVSRVRTVRIMTPVHSLKTGHFPLIDESSLDANTSRLTPKSKQSSQSISQSPVETSPDRTSESTDEPDGAREFNDSDIDSPMLKNSNAFFVSVMNQREKMRCKRLVEKRRTDEIKRRNAAAIVIQRAWRSYGFKRRKFYRAFKEVFASKRTLGQEQNLRREIAAVTIQLAWRRYHRRKVQRSLHPHKRLIHRCSEPFRLAKQDYLVSKIYSQKSVVKPVYSSVPPKKKKIPYYLRENRFQSSKSYNFALKQYHPFYSRDGLIGAKNATVNAHYGHLLTGLSDKAVAAWLERLNENTSNVVNIDAAKSFSYNHY